MAITTHHIKNVLRAYSKQLRQGQSAAPKARVRKHSPPDHVTVSAGTRRKTVIEKVTSDIVHRIIHDGASGDMAIEASRSGKGGRAWKDDTKLVFKVIDKKEGEVTKIMCMEDSKFLRDELEEISKRRGT